jgi:very-short-patch-repair endonuclease
MGEFGPASGSVTALDQPVVTPGGLPDLVDRGRRLFQFLAAAQRLRVEPVRTTETYERDGAVFWLGEIPEHPGITATREQAPTPDAPVVIVGRVPSQDPPPPGEVLEPWLDQPSADPERPPELRVTRTVAAPGETSTALLEDHPEAAEAYRRWRSTWDAWADRERADRPVRALYKELFAAYTTVTNQPEDFELVLGVGCLGWAPDEQERVRRHTLVAPLAIDFDSSSGALTVRIESALDALRVELDMLTPARAPAAGLRQDVVERARAQEAHPLDRTVTGDLLRRLINGLDADGRYDDVDTRPAIGVTPVLAFAPAVVLRRRSRLGLVAVFEQIEAAIAQSGAVPSGLLPLLDPDHVPTVTADPSPGAMIDLGEEVFLPLRLNDCQLDIIQRVDRQAQTLVQGPPGTGKTHLAAALISHLLAQGKRVLVTAHTDRALKEVRNRLPDAIKPLAVAVVGTDRSDLSDLKVAVEHISSRSNDGDPVTLNADAGRRIDAALSRIDEVRRRRALLRSRLVAARAGEVAERSFAGHTGTLASIARTYQEESTGFGWLATHVAPDVEQPAPLTGDEAARWLELLRDIDITDDEADATGRLVDLSLVPAPDHFAALLDLQLAGEQAFAAVSGWAEHPAFGAVHGLDPDLRLDLQQRMTALARQVTAFEQRGEQWMRQALSDLRTGRGAMWFARAEHIDGLLAGAWAGLEQVGPTTRVTVADGADRAAAESLATYLLGHVRANGPVRVNPDGSVKLGTFTGRAVKNSRPLFDAVRVDGQPPTTADRLTAVLVHLDVERHLDALDQAWPLDVTVPYEDTLQERFQWHATEVLQLKALLAVGQQLGAEQRHVDTLGLPQPDWSDLEAVLAFAALVDAATAWDAQVSATTPLQQLAATTASAARADQASVCDQLHDAVRCRDRAAYAKAYHRSRWLSAVRQLVVERDVLSGRVAAAAPGLAAAVAASPHDDVWTTRLPDFDRAWDWARTGSWVMQQETEDANELQRQLDVAEDAIRGEIERLAGDRAWRHALAPARLTGQARADLNFYVRLVRRLGKGTGKYAGVQRAEIRQAMDRCRPAVPVWIMPIYRIAEQLHVTENMFDVVIVDEASQAGLEATFLQYLAPKIVVIGDDKQVSPSAVGVDQQQLRDLAAQYLADHRYKASWQDPKLSLFDAANIWYGAKRTLVEHRRCVPEIIGFSNRIAYEPENIRLIPVRQFGANRLEPVRPVRVPDGYEEGGSGTKVNRPEAEAIVARIQACLADPRYRAMTIGVISLLGPRQAKVINDLLLERIPPQEWAERDLRCGDAAAFQGSERDVMFLSMVSAPPPGQRMGALTLEANVQRYNVAASRAKDQMWVFHSVTLEQLTNPEDMRFQLLDYCYHGVRGLRVDYSGAIGGLAPEDRRVDPFDSLFEQRVHNRLVERGYTVVPQFESMGYRIDLVVIGAEGRLAVECDGDYWHGPDQYVKDLARERDLRRCGWEFFRVKESAFYVDAHAVLSKLWAALDARRIRPAGWTDDVEPDDAEPADVAPEDVAPDDVAPDDIAPEDVAPEDAAPEDPEPSPPRVAGPARAAGGLLPYQAYSGSVPPALDASWANLGVLVTEVVRIEGPVLGARVQSAYVAASGGRRVGSAIAQRLNGVLDLLVRKGAIVGEASSGWDGVRLRTFRLPDQPLVVQRELGPRDLDQLPPLELAALLRDAATVTGWASQETLFREALRRLGLVRLTAGVQQTLAAVLPLARADGAARPGGEAGAP